MKIQNLKINSNKLKILNSQHSPSKSWKQVGEIVGNPESVLEDSRTARIVAEHGFHVLSPSAARRFIRCHRGGPKVDGLGRSLLFLHVCTSGEGYHHLQNQEKSTNN
jgi:hypothetical protein